MISTEEESGLTAVQLLWVNLIQDTLAALALATDPPTLDLLNRKPEPKHASLITFTMWKMIFGQSIVQLAIIFCLQFYGLNVFTSWDDDVRKTIVFNAFVWLQIFNEINCRRIDDKINVFVGFLENRLLIVIIAIMIACQILIISIGGAAFSVTRLDGIQWLFCVGLGFLALPAGALIRLLPNKFLMKFIPKFILERKTYDDNDREIEDWEDAIDAIHNDLFFFKRLRSERRLSGIGRRKGLIDGTTTNGHQSNTPSRRPSPELDTAEPRNPTESDRRPLSQLYSINQAATLIPSLVALSMALPPTSSPAGLIASSSMEPGNINEVTQDIPSAIQNAEPVGQSS